MHGGGGVETRWYRSAQTRELIVRWLGGCERVVWYDHGDDILVDIAGIRVELEPHTLVVTVPLVTEELGMTPLTIGFVFGGDGDGAGLVVATAPPRGNAEIAARWGDIAADAIWACLLSEAAERAVERCAAPHAMSVDGEHFGIHLGRPLAIGSRR